MLIAMNFDAPSRAFLAGAIWLMAGLLLIGRGLSPYWMEVARGSLVEASLVLGLAMLLGAAKGRFVLRRTAERMLNHIERQPARLGLNTVYPLSFYPVLLGMICLGFAVRTFLGESFPAVVAGVYIGIGAALLASALPYFRYWRNAATRKADAPPV